MKQILYFVAILFCVTVCTCSPSTSSFYKYRYFSAAEVPTTTKTKVFIAPLNIMIKKSIPTKDTLPVSSYLESYLLEKNIEVLPQQQFLALWNKNMKFSGGLYNQETGVFSKEKFDTCLQLTLNDLNEQSDFSYVIFPGLIVKQVTLNKHSDIAEWYGVRRELPRERVFNNRWRKAKAASLHVLIINRDNNPLFQSVGGLDFIQVSTKEGRNYVLAYRKDPFGDKDNVAEGIRVALHPFISFDGYPQLSSL